MLCHMAICLVIQLYATLGLAVPCGLALWLSFGLWCHLVLSFGCWVIVWPAFDGSGCCLAILVVVWGIVVGIGLRSGQWG